MESLEKVRKYTFKLPSGKNIRWCRDQLVLLGETRNCLFIDGGDIGGYLVRKTKCDKHNSHDHHWHDSYDTAVIHWITCVAGDKYVPFKSSKDTQRC